MLVLARSLSMCVCVWVCVCGCLWWCLVYFVCNDYPMHPRRAASPSSKLINRLWPSEAAWTSQPHTLQSNHKQKGAGLPAFVCLGLLSNTYQRKAHLRKRRNLSEADLSFRSMLWLQWPQCVDLKPWRHIFAVLSAQAEFVFACSSQLHAYKSPTLATWLVETDI